MKPSTTLFLRTFSEHYQGPVASDRLHEIASEHLTDLTTTSSSRFYSHENLERLTVESAKRLALKLFSGVELVPAWHDLVVDFHRQGWGIPTQAQKPAALPKPPRKSMGLGIKMVLRLIFAATFTKMIIIYFGMKYVQEQSSYNFWMVAGSTGLLFGSLIWFAWSELRSTPPES